MPLPVQSPAPIPLSRWQNSAKTHREEVEKITVPMRARKSRGEKHPVYDFLHTYYSFPLGRLEKWHPGAGTILEVAQDIDLPEKYYDRENGIAWIDPRKLTEKGWERIQWIHRLLSLTQSRPPNFACHGLHEWAMVYSGSDIRHRESAPLRLSQEEIDALVSSRPLCCSHFDAFRFFAPDTIPLNRLAPTLLTREDHEQPGCIHANMDLYKWAYKSSPWISSDLLRKTLFFAIDARIIDMRASPYDLTQYGYSPIPIETPEGRREYEREQSELYRRGLELRSNLISDLEKIL
ncbi:hypothetical protein OAE39_01425 [Akkermansiaceae bacterium]|nr:hypothetical protein [Akkermansiaceae bacterium]